MLTRKSKKIIFFCHNSEFSVESYAEFLSEAFHRPFEVIESDLANSFELRVRSSYSEALEEFRRANSLVADNTTHENLNLPALLQRSAPRIRIIFEQTQPLNRRKKVIWHMATQHQVFKFPP
jgi:hypothetical protein